MHLPADEPLRPTLDFAFALQSGYDAVVIVDSAPRGAEPGTLHAIEPELDAAVPAALTLIASVLAELTSQLVPGARPSGEKE
jgi:hypothetical protein